MAEPSNPFSNNNPFGGVSSNGFFSNPIIAAVPVAASEEAASPSPAVKRRRRKRLKPGERRVQILQTLARMLEERGSDRVTTAQLAARLQISEAALYRHFSSKTQMFEALLELTESYVNGLINEAAQATATGRERAAQLVTRLLSFAEENPGLARILTGAALVYEHKQLLVRMNALLTRFEAALHQCMQAGSTSSNPTLDSDLLAAFTFGRIHVWSRSDFTRPPTANLSACLARLAN